MTSCSKANFKSPVCFSSEQYISPNVHSLVKSFQSDSLVNTTISCKAAREHFRKHKCPQCDNIFTNLASLRTHQLKTHLCNTVTVSSCSSPPCLRKRNRRKTRSHICHVCQRHFTSSGVLARHLMIHTGERPFVCELCEARFTQRTSLQVHVRCVHERAREFVCPHCTCRFSYRHTLQAHVTNCHRTQSPVEETAAILSTSSVTTTSHSDHVQDIISQATTDQTLRIMVSTTPITTISFIPDVPSVAGTTINRDSHVADFTCKMCGCRCSSLRMLRSHITHFHTDIFDVKVTKFRMSVLSDILASLFQYHVYFALRTFTDLHAHHVICTCTDSDEDCIISAPKSDITGVHCPLGSFTHHMIFLTVKLREIIWRHTVPLSMMNRVLRLLMSVCGWPSLVPVTASFPLRCLGDPNRRHECIAINCGGYRSILNIGEHDVSNLSHSSPSSTKDVTTTTSSNITSEVVQFCSLAMYQKFRSCSLLPVVDKETATNPVLKSKLPRHFLVRVCTARCRRTYVCFLCGYTSAHVKSLITHMRSHALIHTYSALRAIRQASNSSIVGTDSRANCFDADDERVVSHNQFTESTNNCDDTILRASLSEKTHCSDVESDTCVSVTTSSKSCSICTDSNDSLAVCHSAFSCSTTAQHSSTESCLKLPNISRSISSTSASSTCMSSMTIQSEPSICVYVCLQCLTARLCRRSMQECDCLPIFSPLQVTRQSHIQRPKPSTSLHSNHPAQISIAHMTVLHCSVCSRLFPDNDSLDAHMLSHISSNVSVSISSTPSTLGELSTSIDHLSTNVCTSRVSEILECGLLASTMFDTCISIHSSISSIISTHSSSSVYVSTNIYTNSNNATISKEVSTLHSSPYVCVRNTSNSFSIPTVSGLPSVTTTISSSISSLFTNINSPTTVSSVSICSILSSSQPSDVCLYSNSQLNTCLMENKLSWSHLSELMEACSPIRCVEQISTAELTKTSNSEIDSVISVLPEDSSTPLVSGLSVPIFMAWEAFDLSFLSTNRRNGTQKASVVEIKATSEQSSCQSPVSDYPSPTALMPSFPSCTVISKVSVPNFGDILLSSAISSSTTLTRQYSPIETLPIAHTQTSAGRRSTSVHSGGSRPVRKQSGVHSCDVCGLVFSRRYLLVRHQRTHTGHRPYQCTVCARAFSQKYSLSLHMRVHTGARPHVCDLCNQSFTQLCNLQKHIRRLHPISTQSQ